MEFSRTSSWFMVSTLICNTTSHFTLSKIVALLHKYIAQCTRMEVSHHVNLNSIIYRKGAIHRTKAERCFLAAKGFNTNLLQFLPPYHVTNVYVYSFCVHNFPRARMCTRNGFAFSKSRIRKIIIYEGLIYQLQRQIWKLY